jgi:hypothetical protein
MDRNAYRDDNDTDQPDAYWRRRVITLTAGLALLGVLAWAFSGGGGKPAHHAVASSSPDASVTPAAAYGHAPSSTVPASTSSASTSSASTSSASTSSASAGLAGAPAIKTALGGKKTGAHTPASSLATLPGLSSSAPAEQPMQETVEPGGSCAPGAVVLSLFPSHSSYSGRQDPKFSIYAVSTGPQECTFAVGPAKLQVVVMFSGRIIWDSSDCARSSSAKTVKLKRGVPVTETVSWNRSVSLPGCVTLASATRAGTYQVQARTGSASSPVRAFKLTR